MVVSDNERIASFYNERYARDGRTVGSVGWSSRATQQLRFDVLLRNIELRGKVFLDVGCGLGDLVDYLDTRTGGDFRYIGIDISEKLIEDSQQFWQRDNCSFRLGDIFTAEIPKKIDVAVSSGTLTYVRQDNEDYAKSVISKMYEVVDEAACLNFMTSFVDFQLEKNYHYDPGKVFGWAKELTRFSNLVHDYDLWEFTLQLLKQPR
jgi:SAM-dependent methyltransferase